MASSVSNKVFADASMSQLIFSNLTLRELDQVKAVRRSFNTDATEVQKRQLPGLFPEEFSQIVRDAAFKNFHRAGPVHKAGFEILAYPLDEYNLRWLGWDSPVMDRRYDPALVDQLSAPIVAGYVDGDAFIGCRVATWVGKELLDRSMMGMYPQIQHSITETPALFGRMRLWGCKEEDLLTLLQTGTVNARFPTAHDRPCCCVRICDWIASKICKKEIERPEFEYAQLRIEHFKPAGGEKKKKE